MRLAQQLAGAAAAACLTLHPGPLPCYADAQGVAIFEAKCAACHASGGNVLQPLKTLKVEALEKNGYAEQGAVVNLLRNGKGQMPKYQGAIPPASRLTDEELEAVAQYVLETAKAGW